MALTDKNTNIADNNVVDAQIPAENEELENSTTPKETPVFDGEIDLSATRKKKFRIDGDSDRILELNTSDLSTITRLEKLYPKLQLLSQDAALEQLKEDVDLETASAVLTKIDMQMRNILDEIFDSNVSEVCAPYGSLFDPFNGEFRFEHITEVLSKLYESNITAEFKKVSQRLKKHTSKYTKGK